MKPKEPRYYVEKDGWKAAIVNYQGRTVCAWEEARPTYSKVCSTCSGQGTVHNPNCGEDYHDSYGWGCDCRMSCPAGCKMIHGKAMAKDEPEHPMPPYAILRKLEEELARTMKAFGKELDSGKIEEEIAKEKAFNASMEGASL